jgi:hypothetical protein
VGAYSHAAQASVPQMNVTSLRCMYVERPRQRRA